MIFWRCFSIAAALVVVVVVVGGGGGGDDDYGHYENIAAGNLNCSSSKGCSSMRYGCQCFRSCYHYCLNNGMVRSCRVHVQVVGGNN